MDVCRVGACGLELTENVPFLAAVVRLRLFSNRPVSSTAF
jgi:hypothetical protein